MSVIGDISADLAEHELAEQMANAWGVELRATLVDCDPDMLSSDADLMFFLTDLCKRIGMEPFGEPWANRFALHDWSAGGYTVVLPITTSLMTGVVPPVTPTSLHAGEGPRVMHLNVFSCKPFDRAAALAYAVEFFHCIVEWSDFTPRGTRTEPPT